jgi:hypothetical protein
VRRPSPASTGNLILAITVYLPASGASLGAVRRNFMSPSPLALPARFLKKAMRKDKGARNFRIRGFQSPASRQHLRSGLVSRDRRIQPTLMLDEAETLKGKSERAEYLRQISQRGEQTGCRCKPVRRARGQFGRERFCAPSLFSFADNGVEEGGRVNALSGTPARQLGFYRRNQFAGANRLRNIAVHSGSDTSLLIAL